MKNTKKIVCVMLCILFVAACFAGCSSAKEEKYSDEVCIIGYTQSVAPFLEIDEKGNATGFVADMWKAIFDDIKGDLKNYIFEKIDEGYMLEDDGGFFDSTGKEYSASLIMGAVTKNSGTFNEDYSFTEPIITNRIIAVTSKNSTVKAYSEFDGAKVVTVSDIAAEAFAKHRTIADVCASVSKANDIDSALAMLDSGKADVVITDEFNFRPCDKPENYVVLENEVDTIEYVIACAKKSGWKDSINEAIREMKSADYGDGDEFTPLVEKYFGYNASSFDYKTDGDK